MKSVEELHQSICRLCLKFDNSKKMVSLFDNIAEGGLSCYAKVVSTLTDVVTEKHDKLPSRICHSCLRLLKQAIYFKLQCEYSNKFLKKISQCFIATEDVKRAIVEFAMLNFYFDNKYSFSPRLKNYKYKPKRRKIGVNEDDNNSNLMQQKDVKYNTDRSIDSEPLLHQEPEILQADDELREMEKMFGSKCDLSLEVQKPKYKRLKRKHKNICDRYINNKKRKPVSKEDSLVCNICHKMLANQNTYEHHMQRHNGCRYICEHCGKGFPVLTELQIHQVARHGTGPSLQCSRCPFKAPRKFDLIEHERIHTGERPYTCDKCGLTFRRRGIWKKHLIYHTEKRIQCPQCHRKFFQRSEMLAHVNNIHERVYVYLCSKCGATYAKIATVRRHMTERHGIPREMQGKIIRINKKSGFQDH